LKRIDEKAACLTPKSLSLHPNLRVSELNGSFTWVKDGLAFNKLIGESLGLEVAFL